MSSKALTKLQTAIIVAVIVCATTIGVSGWWITKREPTPSFEPQENAQRMDISVEAEGIILHYREELLWSENQFSEIMENQDEFRANLIGNFSESLSTHGEGGEYVVDACVEFNETRKSTILRCEVYGAVSKTGKRYTATFFWLLRRLGLDFIDSGFEESKKGLSWEGPVNGVLITISIELPPRDSVYEAWHYPNGHCHAHAWWETE